MSAQSCVAYFERQMDDMVEGRVDMSKFVLRKNLTSKVANKVTTSAHSRVNALRRQREPGSEASLNEQVEYVIVNGWKKEKTTFLAEDAEYARSNRLPLNWLWYFDHAIKEPVRKLFEGQSQGVEEAFARVRARLDAKRVGVAPVLKDLLLGKRPRGS